MDTRGQPIIGYQVEKRKKDTNEWIALNGVTDPIEGALETAEYLKFVSSPRLLAVKNMH